MRQAPIDIDYLVFKVYFQRVLLEPFSHWRTVNDMLTDKRPSSFIKNFTTYLLQRLHQDGYLKKQVQLELVESITLSEQFGSQNSTTSSSNNQQLTRIKERYFVVKIPDLDYLIGLCYAIDPQLEKLREELANEISKIKTVEQLEQFLYRKS